jgi:hypothetical protein
MNFLKKLFGGSGGGSVGGDNRGIYFYVRPKGCEEVVRVRIDRNNDLSLGDDGKTLWVHKVVMGTKCFQRAELDVYFNSNRQVSSSEVSGGDILKQADYDEWVASQQPQP